MELLESARPNSYINALGNNVMSNPGFSQTFPENLQIIRSPHIDMLHCDHWFQYVQGWKLTTLHSICWKCKHVSQDFKPEKLFEVLQVRESGFLALLPALRPRAIVVLGFHRSAFRKQELCSLDVAVAVARRVVQRRFTSGAFPGPSAAVASGGRRPRGRRRGRWRMFWAAELYPFNPEQVSIHLVSDKLPSTKQCL